MSEYKLCKVIEPHELAHHTTRGWRYIQPILGMKTYHLQQQQLPQICHGGSNNGYSNPTSMSVQTSVEIALQVHLILVGMNDEQSLEYLKEQVSAAVNEKNDMRNLYDGCERARKELDSRLEKSTKALEESKTKHAYTEKSFNSVRADLSKTEGQLLKLKAAIGTKTYNELLGT